MSDEISFDPSIPKKLTPEIQDAGIQELKQNSIKKLEQKQMDAKVRAEAGITEIPKEPESVPKELPMIAFKLASRVVACPKMELDEQESVVFAKHLSIIIGAQNSKLYSILIIIVIIFGKIWSCWDAVGKVFKKKEKTETDNIKEPSNKVTETL